MRSIVRSGAIAAALVVSLAVPGSAQSDKLVADVLRDIGELEGKLVQLAKAMPEATYGWKAGAARTTSEVFQHIAADNYLLPTAIGATAPATTGINPKEYKTVQAYETRKASRDEVIADLEKSFAHLKQALSAVTPAQLSESVNMFGQAFTKQQFLILTTTHLHEHLGQMIAYARANNIKPPWSN
jgi:uncharacterized damage-inducible protein DinB